MNPQVADISHLTSLPTRLSSRGTAGEWLGHCLWRFEKEATTYSIGRRFILSLRFQETGWRGGHSFTPLHWGSLSLVIADGLSHATSYLFFFFFLVLGLFPRCRINPVCCLILPCPGSSFSFTLERLSSCFLEYLGVGCFSSCLHSFWVGLFLGPWPIGNLPSFLLMDGCMYSPFYIVAIWMVCRLDASRLFISF